MMMGQKNLMIVINKKTIRNKKKVICKKDWMIHFKRNNKRRDKTL